MTKQFATTAHIIAVTVALVVLAALYAQQPEPITPQNCTTDLECEQVAAYTFEHDSSEVAQ